MIHLDTSFLIRALLRNSPEDRAIRGWLRAGEPLAMSAIGWAEFLCGPVDAQSAGLASRIVADRLPFTEEDAAAAARLFNLVGRRRGSLTDCMIAATALRLGASLATANLSDYRRFETAGLRVIGG
jgi:predicted nucleic acid-binding protein